jgi:hypothetical protein
VFVTVRRYDAKRPVDVIGRRVRDGLVPILRRQSGFRAYYAFASDDGRPVSVSVFDGRGTAMAANERVRAWVAENLEELLPSPPEVTSGEMRHGVVPPRQQPGGGRRPCTSRSGRTMASPRWTGRFSGRGAASSRSSSGSPACEVNRPGFGGGPNR